MVDAGRLAEVGIVGTASYLPARWMTAAEVATASGIPEAIVADRFGMRGKHIAPADDHVTDLARRAAQRLFAAQGVDPLEVDAVMYFGSTWKNHPVWQAAPRIADELGCARAFALELDYVSCGSPVALRVARALLASDPSVRTLLLVGASCESRLLDYTNDRTRFMFNFGDGAVAALLARDHPSNRILETAMHTDGSFSHHVKVPAGGSVEPASLETVAQGRHLLDVEDPDAMRKRLDEVSVDNFLRVAAQAVGRSGLELDDVSFICPIHMKRSIHHALVTAIGGGAAEAVYLDDTGHLSGVDNLLGLDRLARSGRIHGGDVILLLAAGTGYTWAATVLRWGGGPR